MLHYVFLLLFPLVIQCQNESSSGELRLNDTVIPPYRTAFILFNKMIVDKLISIDVARVNRSSSNLAGEFYCTVQEIHSSLKQASSANNNLVRHISIHIDQLTDSISRLENETVQAETTMIQLNVTIENAREQVRLAQEKLNGSERIYEEMMRYEYDRSVDACKGSKSRGYPGIDRWKRFLSTRDFRCSLQYHMHAYRSAPAYYQVSGMLDTNRYNLTKQTKQLEEEIEKYKSVQSQAIDNLMQLTKLNLTLQQQRTAGRLATNLNKHFKLIDNCLKMVSDSSKRLLDVLMNVLNFKAFIEPLTSIYKTLSDEQMIESIPLNTTYQTINKLKRKLVLLAGKLPQVRSRQKQFHQSCVSPTPKSVTAHMDLKLNTTISPPSSDQIGEFRSQRSASEPISKQ